MLPIPSFLAPATVCAGALNKLLQREPWARERLARHAGKTVRFVAGSWVVSLSLQAGALVQASDPAIVPDVTLTIPANRLGQLPQVLRSADPGEIAELMHVQGDAGLARVVSDLARELRWDIEDDLAAVVGDVAAMRLISGAKLFVGGVRQAGKRLAGNVGEYLSEESGVLLSRPAFYEWQQRIQSAQQRLAELEHTVAGLERRVAGKGNRNTAC